MKSRAEVGSQFLMVVDLESTCCDQGSIYKDDKETIEIGAVMVDRSTFQPVSEFQLFVKPVIHSQLTPFCTALTSICQQQVDTAPEFKGASQKFQKWYASYGKPVFCSWGSYDVWQLKVDAKRLGLASPVQGLKTVNIKHRLEAAYPSIATDGIEAFLKEKGVERAGRVHRAIDDARLYAQLLAFIQT